MPTAETLSILAAPLTPSAGVMLILIGLYSLTFNAGDAKLKNHQRSEKAARIGGWFYIMAGAALVSQKFF